VPVPTDPVSQASASYSNVRFVKPNSLPREVGVLTAELFERDHGFVKFVVLVDNNLLAATLANDQASVTPTEVIHTPEGVYRKQERVDRVAISYVRVNPESK